MHQILVVDDDPDTREILRDILLEEGFEVLTASHGLEALSVLSLHTPLLVVLDLYMPQMNGWELLDAMRVDARMRKIQTLVLTSAPGQAPANTPCLAKPHKVEMFLRAVRSVLSN